MNLKNEEQRSLCLMELPTKESPVTLLHDKEPHHHLSPHVLSPHWGDSCGDTIIQPNRAHCFLRPLEWGTRTVVSLTMSHRDWDWKCSLCPYLISHISLSFGQIYQNFYQTIIRCRNMYLLWGNLTIIWRSNFCNLSLFATYFLGTVGPL